MSVWLIVGIVAVVILGAISLLGSGDDSGVANPAADGSQDNTADQYGSEAPATPGLPSQASAGTSLGVRDFTKAAYDSAIASGKVVILFSTAATCGKQCDTEIPKMKSAFAKYPERPIAGFIADINKDQAFMNSLGIFGPDGKAVVIGGEVKTKTPLSWGEDDYAKYIEIYTDGPEDYE